MRVLVFWLQHHEIDDIHHAHLKLGHFPANQINRSQGFQGRHVAGASDNHVALGAFIVARHLTVDR